MKKTVEWQVEDLRENVIFSWIHIVCPNFPKKLIAYGISETKLMATRKGPPNAPSHTQSSVPIMLVAAINIYLSIYHCDVLTSVSQHNPSEVIIKHGSAGTAAMAATPAQGGIHYHCQHITNHTQYPQMWQISCRILPSVSPHCIR